MNPTPEQLAFAFAMMTLRRTDDVRSDSNSAPVRPSSNSVGRIVAMLIVGFATGLLGMSYLEGNVATGGRSIAELRSFGDPSPQFALAIEAGEQSDQQMTEETASVR